jgi:hypothetical protein
VAISNPELDALQAFIESEGYRLWKEHVESEWGSVGFAAKLARTLGDPDLDPKLALAQLQQATVAQRAVLSVVLWPQERIQQLKRQQVPQEVNLSRRGPGL